MSVHYSGVFQLPGAVLRPGDLTYLGLYDYLLGVSASVPPPNLLPAIPPTLPNTKGFTEEQLYDTYSAVVQSHGNQAAKQALLDGQQVIVGLRISVNTRINRGQGVYNDRMAIIWKEKDTTAGGKTVPGIKHGADFTANTQPSAQYEALEKKKIDKIIRMKDGRIRHVRTIVVNKITGPDGKSVIHRHDEGHDVDQSGRLALGRLAEGTYRFYNDGGVYLGSAYLQPRDKQRVQRDISHDGLFTNADTWATPNGALMIDTGYFGVYFHIGHDNNNDSAGCQTLPPAEHARFFKTLKTQSNYSYVLVNLI